jgi:hypothetical protein
MIRPAERVWRLLLKPQSVSMMLMVIGVTAPADTTRRVPGYGGILSLPMAEATGDTLSLNSRIDAILDRRDGRAERGRVLYAAGHEPIRPSTTTAPRTARATRSCPPASPGSKTLSPLVPPPPAHQTVVQARTTSSPNS